MIISLKSELTFNIKTNFRILEKYFFHINVPHVLLKPIMIVENFLNYSHTPFYNENYTFILVLIREWQKLKYYTFLYYVFQLLSTIQTKSLFFKFPFELFIYAYTKSKPQVPPIVAW